MFPDDRLKEIIAFYDKTIAQMEGQAQESKDRAYGGVVRAEKGSLQEEITTRLIAIAWEATGGTPERININKNKIPIRIRPDYIESIEDYEIKSSIKENIENYIYKLSVDRHIYIDGKFVMAIECKSYTENAMLKKILIDFSLLKTEFPDLSCYLFQLESQMGGDYSSQEEPVFGSAPSHTIMSFFPDVALNIVTLLKGERKVTQLKMHPEAKADGA